MRNNPNLFEPPIAPHRIGFASASPANTRALGVLIGQVLQSGDVVLLGGELGAGKTTLVGGVADALGIDDVISSPTYTIVRELAGRIPIAHIDLYRIESPGEIEDLALDELVADRALLVEWGDLVGPYLGSSRLEVTIAYADPDDELGRDVSVGYMGESWRRRWAGLAAGVRDLAEAG